MYVKTKELLTSNKTFIAICIILAIINYFIGYVTASGNFLHYDFPAIAYWAFFITFAAILSLKLLDCKWYFWLLIPIIASISNYPLLSDIISGFPINEFNHPEEYIVYLYLPAISIWTMINVFVLKKLITKKDLKIITENLFITIIIYSTGMLLYYVPAARNSVTIVESIKLHENVDYFLCAVLYLLLFYVLPFALMSVITLLSANKWRCLLLIFLLPPMFFVAFELWYYSTLSEEALRSVYPDSDFGYAHFGAESVYLVKIQAAIILLWLFTKMGKSGYSKYRNRNLTN